ncbi:uncharacterized protein LOC107479817 [Arachis duranensis]|uniref:Uncharacterized protein LOC107479817 n=1 Tax=Arachis duranensis TaxID=130453 RepID=A0A6P4CS21_ARADU|nr:uncharacterized protein LOC107479817 [Arachis duranensis]
MAKPIPKIGSRKNGRIGSRKHARKIPKGVIHVQASFNNTIVTVTDVRGRVISWSSADWTMLDIFYDGLSEMSKMAFDHSTGGSLHLKKMLEEAHELIDMFDPNIREPYESANSLIPLSDSSEVDLVRLGVRPTIVDVTPNKIKPKDKETESDEFDSDAEIQ